MKTAEENIKDLQATVESTRKTLEMHESKYNARKHSLESLQTEFNKILNAEVIEQITIAKNINLEAEKALNKAMDELAISNAEKSLKYPEGTILVGWLCREWMTKTMYKTGHTGKLHIIRKRKSSSNFTFHVGDVIIQHLNDKGEAGIYFSNLYDAAWLPVDVDPNVK